MTQQNLPVGRLIRERALESELQALHGGRYHGWQLVVEHSAGSGEPDVLVLTLHHRWTGQREVRRFRATEAPLVDQPAWVRLA
jgi:hypothetical protein